MKETSKCCNAVAVSSGIPFDGTNAVYTKMCSKCGGTFVPNQPTASCQNKRGEWVPAIPEPYFLIKRMRCDCGRLFWKRESYEAHYALKHILAL